jgi:hypothetical protein
VSAHVDLIACAERELRLRERAYVGWVARGRMSQALADREIALMKEIAAFLREHAPKPVPPPQGALFGEGPK